MLRLTRCLLWHFPSLILKKQITLIDIPLGTMNATQRACRLPEFHKSTAIGSRMDVHVALGTLVSTPWPKGGYPDATEDRGPFPQDAAKKPRTDAGCFQAFQYPKWTTFRFSADSLNDKRMHLFRDET